MVWQSTKNTSVQSCLALTKERKTGRVVETNLDVQEIDIHQNQQFTFPKEGTSVFAFSCVRNSTVDIPGNTFQDLVQSLKLGDHFARHVERRRDAVLELKNTERDLNPFHTPLPTPIRMSDAESWLPEEPEKQTVFERDLNERLIQQKMISSNLNSIVKVFGSDKKRAWGRCVFVDKLCMTEMDVKALTSDTKVEQDEIDPKVTGMIPRWMGDRWGLGVGGEKSAVDLYDIRPAKQITWFEYKFLWDLISDENQLSEDLILAKIRMGFCGFRYDDTVLAIRPVFRIVLEISEK